MNGKQDSGGGDGGGGADGGLLALAEQAAAHSYSPYSGFRVGAALRFAGGLVCTGTNVENASYGLTLCAERAALVQGVGQGGRVLEAVAVWGSSEQPVAPCGACLQALLEFSPEPDQVAVWMGGRGVVRRRARLSELIPQPFRFTKRS